jgi:hypothetical protein
MPARAPDYAFEGGKDTEKWTTPSSGKGDWYRKVDKAKYDEGYERVFGKRPLPNEKKPPESGS